tara:strand:- start:319 stop:897 length:579 start_codon:yes stop_codon:yes gene_type:complete
MKELTNVLLAVVILTIGFNYLYKNAVFTHVKSTVDGKLYLVRKFKDKQQAADMLANISERLSRLVEYVYMNHNDREGVDQLKQNFNTNNIIENTSGGQYTAYSVNKGEELAICLRNAKTNDFIDINLVIFVSIHELAHVMTDEVGHTPKFWDNMRFLLEKGEKINIYKPEDYSKNPQIYCGQTINSTPYKFN